MSALQHIKDYLAEHFAGHKIEDLMQHFEAAIEAKVEEAVAGVRQQIADLRDELVPPVTPARVVMPKEGLNMEPGGVTMVDALISSDTGSAS